MRPFLFHPSVQLSLHPLQLHFNILKNNLHKFLHLKISITFAFPKNKVVTRLRVKFFTGLNFN